VRARISDLPSGSHQDIRISIEGVVAGWSVDSGTLLPADGDCSEGVGEEGRRQSEPG